MLVWIASGLFTLMALFHLAGAIVFAVWLFRHDQRLPRGDSAPPAAVLLSIRGRDPFLSKTLKVLRCLDYPQASVHIVVDGTADEVQRWRDEWNADPATKHPLTIELLQRPLSTCGRKCSALLQALSNVPPEAEVIALIDADVVPDADWLRRLVAPLVDSQVGVVTGGQWFEPKLDYKTGAWVRSLWNAGSLVPTSMQAHPWAGTLAIRRRDFEAAGLAELWRTSAVDDGPIARAMHQIGSRIAFEPRLLHVNCEDSSLATSTQYIGRMLTWSRWYEAAFWNTAVHAGILLLCWLLWGISCVRNVYDSAWPWVSVLAGALLIGLSLYAIAYEIVRWAVGKVLAFQSPLAATHRGTLQKVHRPEENSPREPIRVEGWLLALGRIVRNVSLMPLTHAIFIAGVWRAIFFREIVWRGVTYRIASPHRVELVGDSGPASLSSQGQDSV